MLSSSPLPPNQLPAAERLAPQALRAQRLRQRRRARLLVAAISLLTLICLGTLALRQEEPGRALQWARATLPGLMAAPAEAAAEPSGSASRPLR